MFFYPIATESEISRSSALSSKDSKKRDKSKSSIKSGDLNVEENFEDGFKISQSQFLADIKGGIEEYNTDFFVRINLNYI